MDTCLQNLAFCLPSKFFFLKLGSRLVQTQLFCVCRIWEQCSLILILNWQK